MKLQEQSKNIKVPELNVRSIVCRWADAVKNTISTYKKSQTFVWNEVGASRQDYTYRSSETHGEHDEDEHGIDYHEHEPVIIKDIQLKNDYENEQHEKAMKAEIKKPLDERLRKEGLI